MTRESVTDAATSMLREIPPKLEAAVRERRWIEDWLQAEMTERIRRSSMHRIVEREKAYPHSQEWCDVWAEAKNSEPALWLELKCCVTNYVRAPSDTTSNRPITQQVNEIIRDICKLKLLDSPDERVAMFIAYPMPDDYNLNRFWNSHLNRLRATGADVCELAIGSAQIGNRSCSVVAYGCWL